MSFRQLYLEDNRPWLAGFSGGKDSTMLASFVFDTVLSPPAERRTKPISVVCADTLRRLLARVEEYSERHRAFGLPDDLLNILKDDFCMRDERGVEIS